MAEWVEAVKLQRATKVAPANTKPQFFDRGFAELLKSGEVAEWLKATVLKTVRGLKPLVSSNLTLSEFWWCVLNFVQYTPLNSMLTPKQKDYLETIPDNKVVHIIPFNPDVQKTAYKIISEIESVSSLKIAYFGSSKLGIAGENDIDLNIFIDGSDFEIASATMIKVLGEPSKYLEEQWIRWDFVRNDFPVQISLMSNTLLFAVRSRIIQKTLENNKELLKEYELMKLQANGAPYKEYVKRKFEFFNKILGLNGN